MSSTMEWARGKPFTTQWCHALPRAPPSQAGALCGTTTQAKTMISSMTKAKICKLGNDKIYT